MARVLFIGGIADGLVRDVGLPLRDCINLPIRPELPRPKPIEACEPCDVPDFKMDTYVLETWAGWLFYRDQNVCLSECVRRLLNAYCKG